LPTALYCQQLWQPGKVAGCHREGEHCTYPHRTIDTTVMASQIVMTLQTIVSRNIDPLESVVVSVTSLSTESEAWNVIPERVEIRSTVRTFDPGMRKMAEERLSPAPFRLLAAASIWNGNPAILRWSTPNGKPT
jgi:metal-dependent amidase/aminoacylase/carboxypeptidase family protein